MAIIAEKTIPIRLGAAHTHCSVSIPTVSSYRSSNYQLSTAEPFRLLPLWIWNTIPDNIVSASSMESFRHHLITFIFQRSFCC